MEYRETIGQEDNKIVQNGVDRCFWGFLLTDLGLLLLPLHAKVNKSEENDV